MIKKGDLVQIISGRERGKQGTVERVIPTTQRVVVNGLNLRKRHLKPTRTNPKGGIIEIAGSLDRSNVMVICPHCSKPTRVKHTVGENGKKFRSCSHCQDSLEK